MKIKTLVLAMSVLALGHSAAIANDRFIDVIVTLKDKHHANDHVMNRTNAESFAVGLGLRPQHIYGAALTGFSARIPENRLVSLQSHPRVANVAMDEPVYLVRQPSREHVNAPPSSGGVTSNGQIVPWGVARVSSQSNSNTGAGIEVYILDTGIDGNHRDLNVAGGFAVESCKGRGCGQKWFDDQGHGTHVAGSVAALDNSVDVVGVAPDAILYAVKVLNKNGSGTRSGVIAGVDWVAQQAINKQKAVVANMSLGGSGSKSGSCSNTGFTGTDTYHQAICNAKNVGVVFVVAAGNDGGDAANAVPAAYDDAVITVSATNSSDNWPSWSNWGNKTASWTTKTSAPVAIAAPGVSILSTKMGGGTTTMSGTSMASPHAAGGAALIMATSNQSNNGTAFHNVRATMLQKAESTAAFSNTSGKPHAENFLNAVDL